MKLFASLGVDPVRARVGHEVVLLKARAEAPGGLLHLQPGDVGTAVRVSEDDCAADFGGVTIVVPLDWVASVRYRG